MQHALIPPAERRLLRREYHVRAWIVAFFAISVAGIMGVSALFPAFMKGTLEERLQLGSIASIEKSKNVNTIASIEQELSKDKMLLAALSDGSDRKLLSLQIQDLISQRDKVTITSLSVSRNEDGSVRAVLQGVAPTREMLTKFKGKLESLAPGTVVNLPISQLARSTNVQYSMDVSIPKP